MKAEHALPVEQMHQHVALDLGHVAVHDTAPHQNLDWKEWWRRSRWLWWDANDCFAAIKQPVFQGEKTSECAHTRRGCLCAEDTHQSLGSGKLVVVVDLRHDTGR
jgi:uncharacterized protein YhfF